MKLLVVGLGSIGSRHAANAAALPSVEAAVLDQAPGLSERLGESLGVPYFCDWAKALAWGPEAAVVAVPTYAHVDAARRLVEAGAHVLVEKPISNELRGVDEFLATAEKHGRRVQVVCNMRFHPAIKAVREALPEIGKPLFARVHYGNYLPDMRPGADYRGLYCARKDMGGGVILDAIHEVDYLSWLLGPVDAVSCESARLSGLDIDVEDYACLSLRHSGGVRAEAHLDYLRRCKRRGLEIVGGDGVLVWLSEGKQPESCTVRLYAAGNGWRTILEDPALDASPMYAELLSAFVASIRDGVDDGLLDGREAKRELASVLAAHRSSEQGRVVPLEEMEG